MRSGSGDSEALDAELATVLRRDVEVPDAATCVKAARISLRHGDLEGAWRWSVATTRGGDDYTAWNAAIQVLDRSREGAPELRRQARVAVLGSATTTQFCSLFRLAAAAVGIDVDLYECEYGQYRQEILDEQSALYRFDPDTVILAVHDGELQLPEFSSTPDDDIDVEVRRWTTLWSLLRKRLACRVVQHNFALVSATPVGHLGARLPGGRSHMAQSVNLELGRRAGSDVALVDCERLAGQIGKEQWFDPRYWIRSKQAVSLAALPLLARHTAAVLAAQLGLGRKCVVVDLDNTLWGGVIGEDGLNGIRIGGGGEGEAFVAFQDYLCKLKDKGVVLAVSSKNNPADAREPFESHPEMHLSLDDFGMFEASWDPKPEQLRRIASTLNIALDSLVFVDDNPVERQAVRAMLPEVDVVMLPQDPALFPRALEHYLLLETASLTDEDVRRTEQYRARAEAAALEATAGTIEEFIDGLDQVAVIRPFTEVDLDRIHQLTGKTNQFNLTTPRHTREELAGFMSDPAVVTFTLRLRDRFADHGLVSLLVAKPVPGGLEIDTWLMSCRVIGRMVEPTMLHHLCNIAIAQGHEKLLGRYVPTAKNGMVRETFPRFGFVAVDELSGGITTWSYDLSTGPVPGGLIAVDDGSSSAG